ncbi:MAG: hypothetical protein OEY65_00165 [Gammaproteobacteria bacterium]|nr:hypothetical protein [Gammaproteobacteria bacterium]
MNKLLRISVITLTAALFFLAGCRASPVYNVENAPIQISSNHSSKDITKAIQRAGIALGWQMKAKKPGHIVGTLYLRTFVAVVDIRYTPKSYSITYKSSSGLNYDGTNIHKNYNGWVQNLDRRIQGQLSAL